MISVTHYSDDIICLLKINDMRQAQSLLVQNKRKYNYIVPTSSAQNLYQIVK